MEDLQKKRVSDFSNDYELVEEAAAVKDILDMCDVPEPEKYKYLYLRHADQQIVEVWAGEGRPVIGQEATLVFQKGQLESFKVFPENQEDILALVKYKMDLNEGRVWDSLPVSLLNRINMRLFRAIHRIPKGESPLPYLDDVLHQFGLGAARGGEVSPLASVATPGQGGEKLMIPIAVVSPKVKKVLNNILILKGEGTGDLYRLTAAYVDIP